MMNTFTTTSAVRRRLLCGWALAATGSLLPGFAHAAKLQDIALALVEKYKLGHSLPQVGLQIAAKSPEYQALIDKMGQQQAGQAMITATRSVAADYQKRWDTQLATAYAQNFNEAQLQSLLNQGPQSPHAQLMQSKQADINRVMQQSSSALLREMMAKAYTKAQQPAAAPSPGGPKKQKP
ncbi:hypothetical protein M2375_001257 [Comamonas sp. BIGb0152]|uniref:hypothetical protein n=1 Tax=Comamonas sp. BIGb0152 TaxID=2940601 RepID=UPI00216A41DB|nr:hypothetical protein [Comamonas sp. BIGb0152]MCS4293051.1 hypothetical protein [Comamonas sp. BIGb0152]